jgi:hypothetical protein
MIMATRGSVRSRRFTIYDAMDARGDFESNPANAISPEYKKAEFPKMFYHPLGEEKIVVPAEIIVTPLGPKAVGEQREIINRTVNNEAEEREARSAGWHDHPSKAIAAAGKDAPAVSSDETIKELQAQLAQMQRALADAQALQLGALRPSGATQPAAGAKVTKAS